MRIYIRTIRNVIIPLDVNTWDTIKSIRDRLDSMGFTNISSVSWFWFVSEKMDLSKMVSNYNLQEGSMIYEIPVYIKSAVINI